MSGDIVGRPAGAVLIPPQAARFAALTGADPDRLVLNVTGWNKLALLAGSADPGVTGTIEEHLAFL